MPDSEATVPPEAQETPSPVQGLDELFAPPPDENPEGQTFYRHSNLEDGRVQRDSQQDSPQKSQPLKLDRTTMLWTQLYTFAYLIFFSILGVLARLGLQTLTLYPGALVPNTDLWANFAGCLIIGFLREDHTLFQSHWKKSKDRPEAERLASAPGILPSISAEGDEKSDNEAAKIAYRASRAAVPGYIGLTVGFCGSLTSFASIARDVFFAISNNIDTNSTANNFVTNQARSRSAGFNVMAVLAVCILELSLSLIALKTGTHLAIAIAPFSRFIAPNVNFEKHINRIIMPLACVTWIGAIVFAIFTPHNAWRGQVLFSLIFAPVGCLLRYQLSLRLNRLFSAFPLGTFTANVFGSAVLAMSYDLQHSSAARNIVGCQVLQGVVDGFCGALTTVSTWALELDTLKLKHAYFYGLSSLCVAVGCVTAIIGPVRWTSIFMAPSCVV